MRPGVDVDTGGGGNDPVPPGLMGPLPPYVSLCLSWFGLFWTGRAGQQRSHPSIGGGKDIARRSKETNANSTYRV